MEHWQIATIGVLTLFGGLWLFQTLRDYGWSGVIEGPLKFVVGAAAIALVLAVIAGAIIGVGALLGIGMRLGG